MIDDVVSVLLGLVLGSLLGEIVFRMGRGGRLVGWGVVVIIAVFLVLLSTYKSK